MKNMPDQVQIKAWIRKAKKNKLGYPVYFRIYLDKRSDISAGIRIAELEHWISKNKSSSQLLVYRQS